MTVSHLKERERAQRLGAYEIGSKLAYYAIKMKILFRSKLYGLKLLSKTKINS